MVVDYIQLMDSGKRRENRQQEISEITRALKIIAKELEVPVLTASQLNRDAENKRPQLSNLRESGAIEQDADIVMFIYHPEKAADAASGKVKGEVKSGAAEIIIEKHRNGPTGTVQLLWHGESTRFKEPDAYTMALAREYERNEARKKAQEENIPELGEVFDATPLPDQAPEEN